MYNNNYDTLKHYLIVQYLHTAKLHAPIKNITNSKISIMFSQVQKYFFVNGLIDLILS